MKKIIALAVIFGAFMLISTGVMGAKVLKVGNDPAFPPFESTTDKGEIVGFDIDLIKAVGAAAGYDVQIMAVAWDGIIPGLVGVIKGDGRRWLAAKGIGDPVMRNPVQICLQELRRC